MFKLDNLPNKESYWLITEKRVHIPEHGVWAPGHGYRAETQVHPEIKVFDNMTELKEEIKKLMFPDFGTPTKFRVFTVHPREVETEITISVGAQGVR